MEISSAKYRLQKMIAARDAAKAKYASLTKMIADTEAELDLAMRTQKIMQTCGNATLSGMSVRISKIVTSALQSVFPEPYEFSLDFDIKYGRLSASMALFRGDEVYYPEYDNGDGVIDIIALALRTAVLCLDKRNLRRVLLLDEPCGALSVDMQPYAGKLMRHLHRTLGIQFIMVGAHGNAYREYADKEFQASDFVSGGVI